MPSRNPIECPRVHLLAGGRGRVSVEHPGRLSQLHVTPIECMQLSPRPIFHRFDNNIPEVAMVRFMMQRTIADECNSQQAVA